MAKWIGTEPDLPVILLNSHYDVVPVMREHWNYEPFEALIRQDGFIIGRGTQDMKCVCIQYVEAIRRLKATGYCPKRTVVLTFVPDEETGGVDGMEKFLETPEYKAIGPIAFAMYVSSYLHICFNLFLCRDEGLANPDDVYTVFYGERVPWWLLIKAEGPTGHGSRFIENTAMSKLIDICTKALTFRKEQEESLKLSAGCSHAEFKKKELGDVTTLNLTMLKGGVTQNEGKTYELNVIPTEAEAGFDVRISPNMKPEEFHVMLDKWCEAEGVSWRFAEWTSPLHDHYLTSLDREKNVWWGIFLDACKKMNINLDPQIFPAGTDSRFLRKLGIPVLGFSPMKNSEILLHEHNEMLHRDVFLEGIDVYVNLFTDLFANTI